LYLAAQSAIFLWQLPGMSAMKKVQVMLQSQYDPPGRRRRTPLLKRSLLLQRHPVLTPVILLSVSTVLGIASFFADNVFPVVVLLGIPSDLLYLSIALALGISGVLAGIIGIIECLDRYGVQAVTLLKKEQSYANRN
jgi:hypothetical protein